jgi:hypothetical protein
MIIGLTNIFFFALSTYKSKKIVKHVAVLGEVVPLYKIHMAKIRNNDITNT